MHSTCTSVEPANGDSDLDGIRALQAANLRTRIAPEVGARDGFVTVEHTRDILAQMHALAPSVVARRDGCVIGYALTMTRACRPLLPVLEPMFAQFERLTYDGRPLSSWSFYVMGQICIAEAERGRGLFEALYAAHRAHFGDRYTLLLTEISARNGRSLRAHARVGFSELARYRDDTDDWVIVALNLQSTLA
jgi:predicted GNAT superfamily acetyltransferase